MSDTVTGNQIDHLDFTVDSLPCEMRWGKDNEPAHGCPNRGTVWLTFISREETVCRRIACATCVRDADAQDRTLKTEPLGL